MNLVDYKNQIKDVQESILNRQEKAAALCLIANTIRRCAWKSSARPTAQSLAATAESLSLELGGYNLDGLESLAKKGLLR